MPSFVHPLLLWGLPIMAAPVLIHLINMLRHRRVDWAAMEFLLLSQRKHRTWIILKQLLLLLLRIIAVAAVVLMVAQPLFAINGATCWAAPRPTTSSCSTTASPCPTAGPTPALAQAKAVVERIGAAAARETQPQTFTLLRFSRVGRSVRGGASTAARPGKRTRRHLFLLQVGGEVEADRSLADRRRAGPGAEATGRVAGRRRERATNRLSDFRFPHPPMGRTHRVEAAPAADSATRAWNCG